MNPIMGAILPGGLGALLRMPFILAALALVMGLILGLWDPVRDWVWGRLGFGWIPTFLWSSSFGLALYLRRDWIKRFWRDWLGLALSVAATLGLLSLFNPNTGPLEDASLGGYWGQVLGGSPKLLGIFKVVVLFALVPPIVSPRRAGGVYKQGAKDLLLAFKALLRWIRAYLTLVMGWIGSHPLTLPARRARRRMARRLYILPRKFSRHFWEPPEPEQGARLVEPIEIEEAPWQPPKSSEAPTARRSHGPVKIYGWHLPSLELLGKGEAQPHSRAAPEQMAQLIVATLAEHGLEVTTKDTRVGPRVIRFGLVPGWMPKVRDGRLSHLRGHGDLPSPDSVRVKVQSIMAREKDLALVLKTPHIRLEAPVPGEAVVGLEVPNPFPSKVPIKAVAESAQFQKVVAKGGLPIALGQDTGGEAVVADLLELPHLLIAGATGSGKSVCINSVITSLLLTNRPDRLRLLMIDPKRVELTPFNNIPHLIAPVIVDTEEVLGALKGIVSQMFRRYRAMEELGVRNIEGYNRKATEHMPYLLVIIDELADLMMAAAYEVEQVLVRLAQLGRATGVHLVMATQRPSVNVVTGLLKANVPARLAFAVASQVDSRVILDGAGAEKLLGKGDMLFLSQDSPKPRRVQGALVQDREVEKLVEFWKNQTGPPLSAILLSDWEEGADQNENDEPEDDLLGKARELAQRLPRISPSVLQRRLQIGYSRAADLVQMLEEEGLATSQSPR